MAVLPLLLFSFRILSLAATFSLEKELKMKNSKYWINYAWTLDFQELRQLIDELRENCQSQLAEQIERDVLEEKINWSF